MDFHKTCYWDFLNKGHYVKIYTCSHTYFEHSALKTRYNENVLKKALENNLTIYIYIWLNYN
jgi:hypothetical protein